MTTTQRLRVLVALFGVATLSVAARLVQLQAVDGAALAERALRQRVLVEAVPARPGEILDRAGRVLAITVQSPSLFAVPRNIADRPAFAAAVAAAVDLDPQRLADDLDTHADRGFLWVRRRLSDTQAAAVRNLDLPAGTWGLREEYTRRYPQGTLAAHVLGLRNIDNVGRGGIEARCDELLRGRDGTRVALRDARGRVIDVRDDLAQPPVPGRSVVLSLDAVVQLYAEQELEALCRQHHPAGACAIVLEVKTGDILALASRPTFDPNNPADAAAEAWTNQAVTAAYEPGSTFKPLVVAWAIDHGRLSPEEEIFCEHGVYTLGRRTLHDHGGYGNLSVTDVLVKSSNIGMAKIGERLGIDGLYACVTDFGFGRPTGIALPGEAAGLVRPAGAWTSYSLGSIPMGHELAVTPLQLIVAHGALANGGRLVSPRLVLRDIDPVLPTAPSVPPPQVVSRVVAAEAADWTVREAMTQVVRRGTGRAARLPEYTVFGKTGTAQKFDVETGRFSHEKYVVSFIAGAPAADPAVLVLVMADEPTGGDRAGGTVAAPAAAGLLRRTLYYLGVPPEAADRVAERAQ